MRHFIDLYVFGTNSYFLIAGRFMSGDISGATADAYGVMIPLDIASYIAAWALAIISRVKYKNRFSLVLIIIYGSFTIC